MVFLASLTFQVAFSCVHTAAVTVYSCSASFLSLVVSTIASFTPLPSPFFTQHSLPASEPLSSLHWKCINGVTRRATLAIWYIMAKKKKKLGDKFFFFFRGTRKREF